MANRYDFYLMPRSPRWPRQVKYVYIGDVFKAKMPVTVTCDSHYCTCLSYLGWRYSDRIISIGQGKLIRRDIAGVIMHYITLNIANVNIALRFVNTGNLGWRFR